MATGVQTRENNRGCRGYKPWDEFFWKQARPWEKEPGPRKQIWQNYLDKTQEMRNALVRGTITLEQFEEFCKPFRRELVEEAQKKLGTKVLWSQGG